jgi:folate-binding protein YgfZ
MMNRATVEEQLERARAAAIVVPAEESVVLVVTGSDRQSWLNGLVTCDLAPLKAGQAAYGLAVTQKGRILADVTVLVADDARVLVALPKSAAAEVRESFERYLIMEDVEVAPEDGEYAVAFAHGPRAAEVLDAARSAGALGASLDRSGLGGAVLFAPKQLAPAIDAAIDAALGAIGGARGDASGWEALRVSRAIPRFGVDFDGATYPQEVGLEKTAVSFSKGCYLGQEVVCMLEMRGHVKRKLMPLLLAEGAVPPRGAEVKDASGQKVGEVTSAALIPSRGAPIALAMIKRAAAEPGTELDVAGARAKVIAPEA